MGLAGLHFSGLGKFANAKVWIVTTAFKLMVKKLLADHDTTKAANSTIGRANNLQGIQKSQARALIQSLRGVNRPELLLRRISSAEIRVTFCWCGLRTGCIGGHNWTAYRPGTQFG